MSISLKPGVVLHGLATPVIVAMIVADQVYSEHGHNLTLTSALDGKHSSQSLHYVGQAIDLRTRDVPEDLRKTLRKKIAQRLGSDFDVILEKTHIHIEYQPRR